MPGVLTSTLGAHPYTIYSLSWYGQSQHFHGHIHMILLQISFLLFDTKKAALALIGYEFFLTPAHHVSKQEVT